MHRWEPCVTLPNCEKYFRANTEKNLTNFGECAKI